MPGLLATACQNGYYDVARQLIAAGAAVNDVGNDEMTPLHHASQSGQYGSCFMFFLPNARDQCFMLSIVARLGGLLCAL